MINPKLIFLLLFASAILAWACQPKATPDGEASEIVSAVNVNNLDEARHLADKFFGSTTKLDTVSVSRLCSLAVAMARLSESGQHADDYAAQALQCYRVAMARDSVSAVGYFDSLPADDYQYVTMLRQLLQPIRAREAGVVYTVNEMGEDEIVTDTDSLHNHQEQ